MIISENKPMSEILGFLKNAEKIFADAISDYPDNTALYKAFIQFYIDTNQALGIPKLLSKLYFSHPNLPTKLPQITSNQNYDIFMSIICIKEPKNSIKRISFPDKNDRL